MGALQWTTKIVKIAKKNDRNSTTFFIRYIWLFCRRTWTSLKRSSSSLRVEAHWLEIEQNALCMAGSFFFSNPHCWNVFNLPFLTMSCIHIFRNLNFSCSCGKTNLWSDGCWKKDRRQSRGEKTLWTSWNDPLCFPHMIPVINGLGDEVIWCNRGGMECCHIHPNWD